ncbi:hypothetical protein ACF0H5_018539 [Mactra antiquata]
MVTWSSYHRAYWEISIILVLFFGCVHGLRCWHCISDDCDEALADNYKASKKVCRPGQSCQKVYFEMIERDDDGRSYIHKSTVRGCSENCEDRNDFAVNCSEILKTSRGCVRKDCCTDGDLCNNSSDISPIVYVVICVCLSVYKYVL